MDAQKAWLDIMTAQAQNQLRLFDILTSQYVVYAASLLLYFVKILFLAQVKQNKGAKKLLRMRKLLLKYFTFSIIIKISILNLVI